MAVGNLGRTRHKHRSVGPIYAVLYPSEGFRADDTSTGTFGGGELVVSSFEEDIVYTTKPKSQRHLANACVHTRNIFSYGDPALRYQKVSNLAPGFSGWYTNYYQGHSHAASAHEQALGFALAALPGLSGQQLMGDQGQALMNSGWSKVKPDLTKVDIPNFLLEIGQTRGLLKLSNWWGGKSIANTIRTKDLKHTGKQLANGALATSFGVLPAYGDMKNGIEALTKLQASLAAFKAMVGKRQHRSATVATSVDSATGTFNYGGDSHAPCTWNASRSTRAVAHFTFEPRPIGAVNSVDEFIRGMLDTLGFEANPRIIWEAIPFSFVVDWFVQVGAFLERFKVDALEIPVLIEDGYLSIREDLHIGSRLSLDVNSTISSQTNWPGSATIQRKFWRQPTLPDFESLRAVDVRWPGLKQATLGFALAVQRSGGAQRVTKADFYKPGQRLIMTPISMLTDFAR
jgi:hypothetical protein